MKAHLIFIPWRFKACHHWALSTCRVTWCVCEKLAQNVVQLLLPKIHVLQFWGYFWHFETNCLK
jgi:hypothetical protein